MLPAGVAMGSKDSLIPFCIAADTSLVVSIHSGTKTPTCLSELACEATQKHGVTELSADDHILEQKLKDQCYLLSSNSSKWSWCQSLFWGVSLSTNLISTRTRVVWVRTDWCSLSATQWTANRRSIALSQKPLGPSASRTCALPCLALPTKMLGMTNCPIQIFARFCGRWLSTYRHHIKILYSHWSFFSWAVVVEPDQLSLKSCVRSSSTTPRSKVSSRSFGWLPTWLCLPGQRSVWSSSRYGYIFDLIWPSGHWVVSKWHEYNMKKHWRDKIQINTCVSSPLRCISVSDCFWFV